MFRFSPGCCCGEKPNHLCDCEGDIGFMNRVTFSDSSRSWMNGSIYMYGFPYNWMPSLYSYQYGVSHGSGCPTQVTLPTYRNGGIFGSTGISLSFLNGGHTYLSIKDYDSPYSYQTFEGGAYDGTCYGRVSSCHAWFPYWSRQTLNASVEPVESTDGHYCSLGPYEFPQTLQVTINGGQLVREDCSDPFGEDLFLGHTFMCEYYPAHTHGAPLYWHYQSEEEYFGTGEHLGVSVNLRGASPYYSESWDPTESVDWLTARYGHTMHVNVGFSGSQSSCVAGAIGYRRVDSSEFDARSVSGFGPNNKTDYSGDGPPQYVDATVSW